MDGSLTLDSIQIKTPSIHLCDHILNWIDMDGSSMLGSIWIKTPSIAKKLNRSSLMSLPPPKEEIEEQNKECDAGRGLLNKKHRLYENDMP